MLQTMMLVSTNYVQAMHFSPRKLKASHTSCMETNPSPVVKLFYFATLKRQMGKLLKFKRDKTRAFYFSNLNHFCHLINGLVKNKILIQRNT